MSKNNKIKCVVWDLDNTLWSGILLENKEVQPMETVIEVIKELDKRGVLHSIASRNDFEDAKNKLMSLGLWDYFIYPEIHWENKSNSIATIAKNINISLDSLAFVDDQQFELDEVRSRFPEVALFLPEQVPSFLVNPEFLPRFITTESAQRRKYYQSDIVRNLSEKQHGNNLEFLKSLGLVLTINPVSESDLQRAEELTLRTHQLNTTGVSYNYEELHYFMNSDQHELFSCSLSDKYGEYGTIGLSLIEKQEDIWTISLFLMSCRVMSRNVGNSVLAFISQMAERANSKLRAVFVQNKVNRQMYITYKFNGFEEVSQEGDRYLLEFKRPQPLKVADYVDIRSVLL